MKRRNFLLNFILWLLAFIFGYNLRSDNRDLENLFAPNTKQTSKNNATFKELEVIKEGMRKQKYYVSISEFPRIPPESDDKKRFERAMESLPNGGKIVCEVNEYLLESTLTILPNICLEGQGNGRFHVGTSFKYTGTGAAFNFSNITAGIRLSNFKIYTEKSKNNFQKFTGIDINRGELMRIEDITIENAKIGIDCSGSLGPIYLLKIENVSIWNCHNEGIYVRKTGSWKNGIYIAVGDISDNGIGIRIAKGEGNVIEGKASEIGRNRIAGIKLENGSWVIKGPLWMENNKKGFYVTGGHHRLEGDVMNIDSVVVTGGYIISNAHQAYVEPIFTRVTDKDLAYWYSFDEGEGLHSFDRAHGLKSTFTTEPLWNHQKGFFRSTVTTQKGNKLKLPRTAIDWSKDWTILALGNGKSTSNAFVIKGSNNKTILCLRYYKDGCQLWESNRFKSNFKTYPGVDLTLKSNWIILSYNSKSKELVSYTSSGKIVDSFKYKISSIFKQPAYVQLACSEVTMDEFITYQRILDPTEIASITSLRILPNFNKKVNDYLILKSPDGSQWKQTIDNKGVPKWVKI
ncbi:hypothetical protein ABEX38_31100 [Priestia megaterium]